MLNQRTQVSWWQASESPQVDCVSSVARPTHLSLYPIAKRSLDILISAVALFLLSPLLVVLAIAIKVDSHGPVLHVQNRSGRLGRTFSLYKFRSMTHSPDHAEEHRKFAEAYINGEAVAATQDGNGRIVYKPSGNGRRITRVGRWLRRTSLDELPQLVNVLKGDMSLVGPRPTMDYETKLYTERQQLRLTVLPGLTGWAQIHGRSGLTFDAIVSYDVDYILRRSFWFDIRVLVATIPVVLSAEHAG